MRCLTIRKALHMTENLGLNLEKKPSKTKENVVFLSSPSSVPNL